MPTNFKTPIWVKDVGAYGINIVGLSNKIHLFDFEFGDEFFRQYGTDLISQGHFHVAVELNKHETFIEAGFKINGTATLTCDRSLEPFEFPLKRDRKILFKYGDKDEEISDEIIMIQRDTTTLEVGQYIYEFIALAVPLKKLHPRFREEELEEEEFAEGKIIYTSKDADGSKDDDDENNIDPRWNILKKLK